MSKEYDLIVLGAGNAGFAPAGMAKEAGQSVLVVESRDFGGTCAIRGCVPKKVLVAAGETLDHIAKASDHKIDAQFNSIDWPALIERKETFIEGVPDMMEGSLTGRDIDTIAGRAKFSGPNEIEVNGETYAGKKFVIGTGSKNRELPIPGFEHTITSDDILDLKDRPDSIIFIGAGVIALEFGHVFARTGSSVTLLEVAPQPLPMLDEDAVAALATESQRIGLDIRTAVSTSNIEKTAKGFAVTFEEDGKEVTLTADVVANGAGRIADVEDLNLEAAGIEHDRHIIAVDEHLRSVSNQNVYVAGDANAVGGPQLSPVATYEGRIVGHNLLNEGGELKTADYTNIPSCVFTTPQLASVGLKEDQAKAQGLKFSVKSNNMVEWRSAKTYAEKASFAKVLVEDHTGKILGAHLLGHGAPETIHLFAFAITYGVTAEQLGSTVYAYPTFMSDIKFLI
ncbi:MAG: NAD(P)/FAD-dependent oxidoreductase [Rhodospirillaceae bacterium]|jgi:glutathione reductase (NADPH)|nr:NAD(P)/FAD-dependent oxidoreductase [Rhodospirillaceae bacterium]